MSQKSGLVVRQHERREIELPVEFVVGERHQAQVRFSPSSSAFDRHVVRGTSVDVSSGGIGMNVHEFLPRMCEGSMRVFDPHPVGSRNDGTPIHEVAFEHEVKVRRVQMIGHEPTYFVGMSFLDPEPDLDERLTVFLKRVSALGEEDEGKADA